MKLLLVLSLATAASGELTTLLRHNCDGTYELMPSLRPFGIGGNFGLDRVLNKAFDRIKKRLQCSCPGFTDVDHALHFDPMAVFLNQNRAKNLRVQSDLCGQKLFGSFREQIERFNLGNVALPDTCTYEKYIGEGCSFAIDYSQDWVKIKVGVALKQCPGSPIPFFSLNCIGDRCQHIGKVKKFFFFLNHIFFFF